MRVVLQRSKEAKVTVDGKVTGQIEKGYVLLVGINAYRYDGRCEIFAKKIAEIRLWKMKKEK